MTGQRILVLTDGERNLAHYMDLLRQDGFQVVATSRIHELLSIATRHSPAAVIVRANLLGAAPGIQLARVMTLTPGTRIITASPRGYAAGSDLSLAHANLAEPFPYSQLLQALGRKAPPAAPERPPPEPPASPAKPLEPAPPRADPGTDRILECCRRFTELEQDREQLLSTGLEIFLDLFDAERGSIMLKDARGENLIVVRKAGFPAEAQQIEPVPLGSSLVGQVALKPSPLLVENIATPSRPGYRGGSFMIVPLRDWRIFYGVVNITDRRNDRPFDRADIHRAELLANQFAVNLANATQWAELQRLTVIDPLTGLYNRRYFDRHIDLELERARRYERQVTLSLIDVDHFKTVNDRNGYSVGDALIRAVAEIIRQCFREVDIVTRWGGDEFAVLLPDTGRPRSPAPGDSSSVHFVERVRRVIERQDFRRLVPGLTLPVTVSCGVATFPNDASDRQSLFRVANQALQRAKRSGSNRVSFGGEGVKSEERSAST